MANRNINGDVNVEFNEASSRQGLDSGESVKTLFGKIRKWLSDLKAVAFSGSYNDLTNKPAIPPEVAVKGNAEAAYRTGNVNLTPSNLGLDPLGYYGIGGRTTNTTANPWVLVAETTASTNQSSGITLLFDYTFIQANNLTSTGTGILSVGVRTDTNGAIIANRSYAKWLTKMNELNNDDVIITYNNSTKSLQIWAKSDYAYKIFRVRPLSGSNVHSSFDISKWTFTASLNTNMHESYPTGDGITVLTPTCDMQEQINYNSNNGVKNRLKINIPEKTVNGLTFTPQSDGTIVINGTANVTSAGIVYFNLENPSNTTVPTQHSLNKIGYRNFIVSLNGGEEYMAGIALQILCYDTIIENPSVTSIIFVGESKSVTINEDKKYVWFRLYIGTAINGKTFNNFVLKPMIRDASIEGDTFEPYAEPNSRLTQKVDKALEQTGYNLLKLTTQTVTTNNVTFTVDDTAGTITATRTGTQTANAYLNLDVPDTVYGKMCLSGCADGGNANTYSVYPWDSTTNARPKNWEGTANAETSISASDYVEVNYVQGHTNRVTIRITPTASFTSLTFTPMIVPAALANIPFQPYAKSNAELTQDLGDISEELDCLIIRASLVNNEVRIQNTSDFTDELFSKYNSYTKPKFAILELYVTSNTYHYKALINSSSVRQALVMEASFIEVNGTYMSIYKFNWSQSGTVGTPTVSYTSLNLGS